MNDNLLNSNQAKEFLNIDAKLFDNYRKLSKEINSTIVRGRLVFNKKELIKWKESKDTNTVVLDLEDYETCFKFAIKMAYGGMSLNGIRGQRSEVQAADDVILGILAEHAIKKFLKIKHGINILLDEEVHTNEITPQDFDYIVENDEKRRPKLGVGVKASKFKSCHLVLGQNEVENSSRASDVYIFARVDLPSDHLFRILRDHSFFKEVKDYLESDNSSKKINELGNVPVWICGFAYKNELEKVTSIPNQDFSGYRYVKSVSQLHNSDEDWKKLLNKL